MSAIYPWRDPAHVRKVWAGMWAARKIPTNRRRDKKGSPVAPQAIEMAGVPACHSVGVRAGIGDFVKGFNADSGTAGVGRKEGRGP